MKYIKLRNVQTNNLKGIDLDIPRNKLTVITGLSGSGKTSLAFDTIYAQARKEYLESFSVYSRGELGKIRSADFDSIEGLSPAIAIEQKRLGNNPRSTIGTFTDIYTHLRLLFSRFATPRDPKLESSSFSFNNPDGACPKCKGLGYIIEIDKKKLIDFDKSLNEGAINLSQYKPGSYVLEKLKSTERFDFDKKLRNFSDKELNLLLYAKPKKFKRTRDDGLASWTCEGIVTRMKRLRKRRDKKSLKEGSGPSNYKKKYYSRKVCPSCKEQKLKPEILKRKINGLNIAQATNLSLRKASQWLEKVEIEMAEEIINGIKKNLDNLISLGLDYLNLDRPIPTLSGGESQRVKLANHLGLNLIEMIYILDEPTIGMHRKNIRKIINILKKLRDKGNTIIVVEHDKQVIKAADFLVDIGPKAGDRGGKVVASGSLSDIKAVKSLTAKVLNGEYRFKNRSNNRNGNSFYKLKGASKNNLKNIDVKFMKNAFNLVTGVSGAGKSSLVEEFLEKYKESIFIDQSAVGKSKRSNVATYSKLWNAVRNEFAKSTNCSKKLLSFNSEGGCLKCKGLGQIKIDMHFLDDTSTLCSKCEGKRFNKEALGYKFRSHTIADVLNFSVEKALKVFEDKRVLKKLKLLKAVGLGYIKLGQPLPKLSGGEAQRVKLAKYLDKKGNVLVLDEPTIGLHTVDIDKLLTLFHRLIEKNNTLIIIEHNEDVIRNADWVIKLGPSGGKSGGKLLFEGKNY